MFCKKKIIKKTEIPTKFFDIPEVESTQINPGFEVALHESLKSVGDRTHRKQSLAVVTVMQQGGPVGWMLVGRKLMAHTLGR